MQNKKAKILLTAALILSFVGLIDATYLTVVHYKHIIPPCTLQNTCETVLTSKYATIGNIPIALIGSLFYFIVGILLFLLLDFKKKLFLTCATILTTAAVIISVILIYIQAAVIYAFCYYCLASEATNFLLFGVILLLKRGYFSSSSA